MSIPATVVINAAGRGRRLGQGRNKALVEVAGRPLLWWQLHLIPREVPVVIGVGFQAGDVVEEALAVRTDVSFAVNKKYEETGTAATLAKAVLAVEGRVTSLDADLIVHPEDLRKLLFAEADTIGVLPRASMEPVGVRVGHQVGRDVAWEFTKMSPGDTGVLEWSGLVNFDPTKSRLGPSEGHVFEYIAPGLPMDVLHVRARELDFPEELPGMTEWIRHLEGTCA